MLSYQQKLENLRQSIAALESRGRPTDYLEERLAALMVVPRIKDLEDCPTYVDIFAQTGKPVSKFIHVSEVEAAELQTFGYVISNNPLANNNTLRSHPAYIFYHAKLSSQTRQILPDPQTVE